MRRKQESAKSPAPVTVDFTSRAREPPVDKETATAFEQFNAMKYAKADAGGAKTSFLVHFYSVHGGCSYDIAEHVS